MILQINSLEEYKETVSRVCKGLVPRYALPSYRINDPDIIAGYDWNITDPELMKDPEIREIFGSNTIICDEFIELKGKMCFVNERYVGILEAILITEEDFYYAIRSSTGKLMYHSCVGSIKKA